MNSVVTPTPPPKVIYPCQVIGIVPLSAETFEIELQSPVGTVLDYYAGQYMQLDLDVNGDGQLQTLFYTIANSPDFEQPRRLLLFLQKGSEFADKVLRCLTNLAESQAQVDVTLAMGRAFLQTDLKHPHVLIAAGSGISKIKCITEEILRQNPSAEVKIYWSNKSADGFYLLDTFETWEGQNQNLCFTPILESSDNIWQGRSGYIYEVIEEDYEDLSGVKTYLCGSPNMVYGTIDKLKPLGLKEENCFSDVFEFAPRK